MALQVTRLKRAAIVAATTLQRQVYTILLLLFPFADQIIDLAVEYSPLLGRHMPSNVYKWVGFALVAAKVLHSLHRAYRDTKDILK